MNEPEPIKFRDQIPEIPRATVQPVRPVGAPLSIGGNNNRQPQPAQQGPANRIAAAPPAGRALPAPAASDEASGVQRAVNAFRAFMPVVQRLLPLIDGNIGTAVANLIAPRPQQAPPPQKVDLAPLEEGLTKLQTQHLNLRDQVIEQNTALKRVEDQLEHVREATDRNTLEQQELLEDLKAFSGKIKIIAVVGISLLAVGFLLELAMFFHLQRVLP
jgi:hypothetical protein